MATLEVGKTYKHTNGYLYECRCVHGRAAFMVHLESDTALIAVQDTWYRYTEYREPRKTSTYWFPVIEGRDLLHSKQEGRILIDPENFVCGEKPTHDKIMYYGALTPVIKWVPLNYEEKA